MEYLSLPFLLRKGFLDKTDLYDSITNSIGLILSTRKGSLPFDPEYGCDLWDKEFSDLFMANRSELQGAVRNAIDIYEARLFNVSVSLMNIASGPDHPLGIAVKIIGNFKDENDERRFEEIFSIG
ncbi:MAG: GPW/gp25 family protein [Candidatus Krumholzibacteriota bacterium]|nr:GPW/gp25 family protein [Candidatus Krumholzibacteriota bacterium]